MTPNVPVQARAAWRRVALQPAVSLHCLADANDQRRGTIFADVDIDAYQFGIADRWKCTICQSEPRLATTKVTRPLALTGFPSRTPVTVSKPVTTTAVSDNTMAE